MNMIGANNRFDSSTFDDDLPGFGWRQSAAPHVEFRNQNDQLPVKETDPRIRTELAGSLHFILSQYLKPSTLRRLIAPHEAMLGRVMLGRSMQGEIDDDLLARILAQAVVEHIRQSGFVVQRRPSVDEGMEAINAEN
jgi:hypothetical protein